MKRQTKLNQQIIVFAVIAALIFILSVSFSVFAQDTKFKEGDRVEADVNMSSSPEYQRWRKATVVKVLMWQGNVSGISIKTDDGVEMVIGEKYLRKISEAAEKTEKTEDKNSTAKPTVGEKNPPKEETADKAAQEGCEFYKDYKKVSNTAPASAELFKGVIFEWYKSTKGDRYEDFGLIFEDFKMGASYKNRARGNGRKDVDTAPVGATIYPLKTKLVFCEKGLYSTYRTEWTNEYACFKNRFGEWACYNGAPQNYKRNPVPNK